MKKHTYLFLALVMVILTGCSKDDNSETSIVSRVFQLSAVSNSNISGTATFIKKENGLTEVVLQISNSSTDIHPAKIYLNNAVQGGEAAITLAAIECDCEASTTMVSKLDNGTAISYEELVNFNGHIKIHQNENHMEIIIAQGNIGSNVK
ncbi:hypothetical protein [Sediminicola luteus]|uniref:CHRD domain-containing protein n=1 Tax=Sediminicola luteus TaxID=319238 RepID=A0ABV2U0L0_9FLAO